MPDNDITQLDPQSLSTLLKIMKALRHPQTGCPWDIKQTHKTIAPYAIEEAYEVVQAIDNDNMDELQDELGDLLLQVVFHAEMASERSEFTIDDVIGAICTKMIRRHPHVFGNEQQRALAPHKGFWEDIKATETTASSNEPQILSNIPVALPALTRAEKLQKKAARVGFDWPDVTGVFEKIQEETNEIRDAISNNESDQRIGEEIGDLLFSVVNLSRHLSHDPETVLRHANNKFQCRFNYIEENADKPINEMDIDALESLWKKAKAAE